MKIIFHDIIYLKIEANKRITSYTDTGLASSLMTTSSELVTMEEMYNI